MWQYSKFCSIHCHCWMGDRKVASPQNPCCLSVKVRLQNKCKKNTKRGSGYAKLTRKLLQLLLHPLNSLFSRTTRVSRYQKGKTSLDINEAVGCSSISWTICKQSAPRSEQPHQHFVTQFLQAGCSS